MKKGIIYLNAFMFAVLVALTVSVNVRAEDRGVKYGPKGERNTSVHYLRENVEHQGEIIMLLKAIREDSKQDEIIDLLNDIKKLLERRR